MAFDDCAPKTNLSYHFARLREAGITRVRIDGPYRKISLRIEDLEARFPGLLETILAAAHKGFASVDYKKTYADYQKIIEEVMRTEKLPSSYKYYVKRYFAKIHPSMEPQQ